MPALGEMIAPRAAFGDALAELGHLHNGVVVFDSDVSTSTHTARFGGTFPDRFYQMGIAEANMVGAAAENNTTQAAVLCRVTQATSRPRCSHFFQVSLYFSLQPLGFLLVNHITFLIHNSRFVFTPLNCNTPSLYVFCYMYRPSYVEYYLMAIFFALLSDDK